MNIASIDIGSNSVILLTGKVDKDSNHFTPLKSYYATPRISKNLVKGGNFSTDAVKRLKETLNEFIAIALSSGAELILPAATQAFRRAGNAPLVVNEIKEELGIEIRILSGYEEGMFTFAGATSNIEDYSGYMIDIGGGSTEIFVRDNGNIHFSHSYNFGAVSTCEHLKAIPPFGKEKIEEIKQYVSDNISKTLPIPSHPLPALAVAGTSTTLACMQLGTKIFNEEMIDGFKLHKDNIGLLIKEMAQMTPLQILETYGDITAGREDVILAGTVILYTIMDLIGAVEIIVSTRGLRHGIILDYLKKLT